MTEGETLRKLRMILVELYTNSATIQRVVEDAGLSSAQVNFQGTPNDIWHSVLWEAKRQVRVDNLVQVVGEEYPKWHKLMQTIHDERVHSEKEALISTIAAMGAEIKGHRELFRQYKQNLRILQQKRANYAKGEEPLSLDNQIDEEAKQVENGKSQLKECFYRKLLYLVLSAKLDPNEIGLLYRDCRPKHFAKSGQPETDIQLVEWIWGMRDSSNNETPILEFVERLIRIQRPSLLEALQAWRNDIWELGLLTVQPPAIAEIEHRVNSTRQYGDSALLVEIVPASPDATDYRVCMYYWENGTTVCWHKQPNDESGQHNRKYKLYEIPNLLHGVLSIHEEKPTSIEFLLPEELLNEPVDQWASENDIVKFCSEHRIMIRSQERIAKRELSKWRQAWHDKWQMFQTLKTERDIYWLDTLNTYEVKTLATRLLHAKEKATCLGLTFLSIHQANVQERTNILRHILRAGVPIMAWSRPPAAFQLTVQNVRHELKTILHKEHLDELPIIIHNLRTCPEVLESEEHIGNRLALFWDDPDRIPEGYR